MNCEPRVAVAELSDAGVEVGGDPSAEFGQDPNPEECFLYRSNATNSLQSYVYHRLDKYKQLEFNEVFQWPVARDDPEIAALYVDFAMKFFNVNDLNLLSDGRIPSKASLTESRRRNS